MIFIQHVVYRLIIIRRVAVGMIPLEIGEESFFIDQIGGVFRIHPPPVRGGTRRSFSRSSFSRVGGRWVWRGVCGFPPGRYEDGLMIAIRWNFVVNQLVFIPLGGQDAGEGVGDLVYEARAVLNGEIELRKSLYPKQKSAGRIGNHHQPAEGVVVCPCGERESLGVWSQRSYAPYDGVAFAFGKPAIFG